MAALNIANLAANATSLVIHGHGFSAITANNQVTFSGGVTGNVTRATATTLTITGLSALPTGSLTARSVTSNSPNSPEPRCRLPPSYL